MTTVERNEEIDKRLEQARANAAGTEGTAIEVAYHLGVALVRALQGIERAIREKIV